MVIVLMEVLQGKQNHSFLMRGGENQAGEVQGSQGAVPVCSRRLEDQEQLCFSSGPKEGKVSVPTEVTQEERALPHGRSGSLYSLGFYTLERENIYLF